MRGQTFALAALGVLAVSISLQGCDLANITGHRTAAWASKPTYLSTYGFVPPGMLASQGVLNSCEVTDLSPKLQCSGNGVCRVWNSTSHDQISFCECYLEWADPECRTPRKSQTTCYLLSLFFGYFGLDRFYLGEYTAGFGKLSTLGGVGVWWIIDVVRVGSSPVYSQNFRLSADLPHGIYVICTTIFFALMGNWFFSWSASKRRRKNMSKMLLQAEDRFFKDRSSQLPDIDAEDQVGQPTKSSWGTPTPVGLSNYGTLHDQRMLAASQHNPFSSYSAWQDKTNYAAMAQGRGSTLWSAVREHRETTEPGFAQMAPGSMARQQQPMGPVCGGQS